MVTEKISVVNLLAKNDENTIKKMDCLSLMVLLM